jgi:hypothetical protein
MKWGWSLAAVALCWSALGLATSVDKIVVLNQEGTNFDIAPSPNGDLHVTCRTGAGSQTNFKKISYFKYTKASDTWGSSVLVFAGDAFTVSTDIDTNQPAIAWDAPNVGSWIVFSGNVRRPNQVPAYFVDDSTSTPSLQGNLLNPGLDTIQELRAVDVAIAADGTLWGCFNYTNLQGHPEVNGIYCNNNGTTVERATGQQSAGEGLSVALGPGGKPHIMTTFGRSGTNAAWSPRDSVSGGNWSPGGLQFGGIPGSAGKVSCVNTTDDNKLDCAAVTALTTAGRATFAYSMDRSSGSAVVVKGSALQTWGVNVSPGAFNSEGLKYARSAGGKEAISYAMDDDPTGPLDLAVVMVKPPGVDWPQASLGTSDVNADGVHDEMGGTGQTARQVFLGSGNPPLFQVFDGTQGRSVVMFAVGETPAVAFSGEDLWVVFHDIVTKQTKAAKISIGPPVPEISHAGLLVLLAGFSALLLRLGANRGRQSVRPV